MIRRPPRSTPLYSSAASDVYKRQVHAPVGAIGCNQRRNRNCRRYSVPRSSPQMKGGRGTFKRRKTSSARGEARIGDPRVQLAWSTPRHPALGMPATRATMWVSFSTMANISARPRAESSRAIARACRRSRPAAIFRIMTWSVLLDLDGTLIDSYPLSLIHI